MTDDYCCLACADGEWSSNANPRLKPADIGSIILHSPKKCLADYIARIKHQRDDAWYQLDQENRLRLQAESRCDRLLWSLEDAELHREVYRRLADDPRMDDETKDYEFDEMLKIVEAERNA